ncbi:MAG TPA: TetR/AcrR family transcriptional regulator [Ktedonobacterales bacterium]|nr:TetR/AcrR family transcriptional regulator [Ktedonobacterales bacterium]
MTRKRPYQLKRRAERQDETRRRIAEATMELHEEVGPAQTTISAVAERAGVERLTVYRHFPTERELLRACQQHFLARYPYPDPATWAAIADPRERLRVALCVLYARYRTTEAMTANLLRDAPSMPALAELLQGMPVYVRAVRDLLAAPWGVLGERRALLEAVIGHALDFETWRSLARRQGLTDEQAVDLMVRLVVGVAEDRGIQASG